MCEAWQTAPVLPLMLRMGRWRPREAQGPAQGSANFFCKEPERNRFRLCEAYGLCYTQSLSLFLQLFVKNKTKSHSQLTKTKQAVVDVAQGLNLLKVHSQGAGEGRSGDSDPGVPPPQHVVSLLGARHPSQARGSSLLTLQAVVHGEMLGLFKSSAHDWPLEECVDGVHLGGRKFRVSLAPAPAPGLSVLTRGDGRNPRSGQGWDKGPTWLKRCSRQP